MCLPAPIGDMPNNHQNSAHDKASHTSAYAYVGTCPVATQITIFALLSNSSGQDQHILIGLSVYVGNTTSKQCCMQQHCWIFFKQLPIKYLLTTTDDKASPVGSTSLATCRMTHGKSSVTVIPPILYACQCSACALQDPSWE